MSDRYHSLTVALERDIRDDEAEYLMDAIKLLRGVMDVTGNVTDPPSYTAHVRITHKVTQQLQDLIKELNSL